MNFKTKIVILSLILIGTCLIQIALHKKTYEGFVSVSNTESTLSAAISTAQSSLDQITSEFITIAEFSTLLLASSLTESSYLINDSDLAIGTYLSSNATVHEKIKQFYIFLGLFHLVNRPSYQKFE